MTTYLMDIQMMNIIMEEDTNLMSLRMFHIIFVSISGLLMVYMASWSYMMWNHYADSAYLSYLSLSIISLIILLIYGKKFIKKYKNI